MRSRVTKYLISSNKKFQFSKHVYKSGHQVEKYNNFINDSLNIKTIPKKLLIDIDSIKKKGGRKVLGLNPGASYGSSKRWYPKEFAGVATTLSNHYDIVIFGISNEEHIFCENLSPIP